MDSPWTLSPDQVLDHFQVNSSRGLSSEQAIKHAEVYGTNGTPDGTRSCHVLTVSAELPDDPATPLWELILEQFKDQLVLILLASAFVSFVLALIEAQEGSILGAFVEPLVILLILIANAAVGVIQETNAEKAIDVSPFLSIKVLS